MSSRRASRIALAPIAALLVVVPRCAWAAGTLNLIPDLELVIANLFVLLLLIYPVNRWLLQPLNEVARERETRTAGAQERAERIRAEAGELSRRFEALMQQARGEAQARHAAIKERSLREERALLASAREAAAAEVEEVSRGIAAELESARERLREDAEQLAREAASKILGRAI